MSKRFNRLEVEEAIGALLAAVRSHNAQARPDEFVVTQARLYGSALDGTLDDYGDVDVDLILSIQDGSSPIASAKISEFRRQIARQESIRKKLERASPPLQVSVAETDDLGCSYKVIFPSSVTA